MKIHFTQYPVRCADKDDGAVLFQTKTFEGIYLNNLCFRLYTEIKEKRAKSDEDAIEYMLKEAPEYKDVEVVQFIDFLVQKGFVAREV